MALRRFPALVVVLLLLAIPLQAQTVTGTLQGKVTDPGGAALPGATVSIRNMETGYERVTVSNQDGAYSAPFLPVGKYRVTAELSGLGSKSFTNVGVALNTTTTTDFALAPQMAETVTVNAEAPHINTTDAEIKQTMNEQEIMERPNANPQSFLDLASVFAGFDENPTSGQNNPTASSGSSINFNGAGTRGATFQINGVNNDDSSENQHRQGVTLATIKSFQVISNNYSAEFGRGYGAVVLVQTKSGTNSVAGETYFYKQKSTWNNKNLTQRTNNASIPPAQRSQYGLTLGFPIIKDTVFAFVAGDKVQNDGDNTATRTILSPADRLRPRLTLGNDTPENRAFLNQLIGYFPEVVPNAPANPTNGWVTNAAFDFPADDYSGRLDWNMRQNMNSTARYQRTHQEFVAEDILTGERADQNNRQSNFGLTWTNILNANIVQEARYGLGLRSTHVYIAAGNDTPIVRYGNLPAGTTNPIIGNAGNFPIDRVQRDNQFVYNINAVIREQHTLRGGVDLRRASLDDRAENFNRGFWTFNASCGVPAVNYGTGFAAMMAGCVATYQKGYGPAYLENRMHEENIYLQDDWHVSRNLTLNLGARAELVSAPEDKEDRIDYQLSNQQYIDPRLGFAYTPGDWANKNSFLRGLTGGEGKSSVRGGFGVFHGRVFQSIFSQTGASVRFNPPYGALLTFTNQTNISDPTNGFVFTPGTRPNARISLTTVEPDLEMPETHQWNLTFERQLFMQSRMRLSYIGTQARNLLQFEPWNLPIDDPNGVVVPNHPFNGALAGQTIRRAANFMCAGTTAATVTAECPTAVPIAATEYSVRVPRVNERRPSPTEGQNLLITNKGKSWYHGGQLEWESGPMKGFLGRFTYTFSKTIDNGSEATAVGAGDINIFPPGSTVGSEEYARGLSRFHTPHRFTLNGSYLLPFFKNRTDWMGSLLGGWQVSGVFKFSTGTPFTVIDGGAYDIDVDGIANQRPVVIDPSVLGMQVNRTGLLPRSAFRRAVYGDTLADLAPRNAFYLDGVRNIDAGLFKTFGLPKGLGLSLRLEVYNLLDHVQYGFPTNDINNAAFGNVTAQFNAPRTFQAALRFIY